MSHTILTEEDVRVIYLRLSEGEPGAAIARDFAISQQVVSSIKTGECWGAVTGLRPRVPREDITRGILTREQVLDIDAGLKAGVRVVELAKRHGVAPTTIYELRLGHTWAWLTGRPYCEPRNKSWTSQN